MENIQQYVKDTGILQITKMILTEFNEMKQGEVKIFDIAMYGIVFKNEEIYRLKVIKANRNTDREYFSSTGPKDNLCIISAANPGGLAHEICHMVYKRTGDPKRFSRPLTHDHIVPFLIKNKLQNIVDYINAGTVYDKFIGYLYLADNEELTAKLTGFFVSIELTNSGKLEEDNYIIGLKQIYNSMKVLEMDEDTIQEILKTEKENRIISQHLYLDKVNQETIRNLIIEINEQGSKFENIYRDLIIRQHQRQI